MKRYEFANTLIGFAVFSLFIIYCIICIVILKKKKKERNNGDIKENIRKDIQKVLKETKKIRLAQIISFLFVVISSVLLIKNIIIESGDGLKFENLVVVIIGIFIFTIIPVVWLLFFIFECLIKNTEHYIAKILAERSNIYEIDGIIYGKLQNGAQYMLKKHNEKMINYIIEGRNYKNKKIFQIIEVDFVFERNKNLDSKELGIIINPQALKSIGITVNDNIRFYEDDGKIVISHFKKIYGFTPYASLDSIVNMHNESLKIANYIHEY